MKNVYLLFLFTFSLLFITPTQLYGEIPGDATRDGQLGLGDALYILQELVGIRHPIDYDDDGYDTTVDCNDNDPNTHPEAAETCDGKDNDCDGQVDEDYGDLGVPCLVGVGICQAAGIKVCREDGTGTDCSAVAGVSEAEICDGLDNDCDGQVDEGASWENTGESCTTGIGVCLRSGIYTCNVENPSGPTICSATAGSADTEVCDGLDNDCDGQVDEDLPAPLNTNQTGECAGSTKSCYGSTGWKDDYNGIVSYEPTELSCDGLDNDCDGLADNNLSAPYCANQGGVCSGSTKSCGGLSGWLACTSDNYGPNYESVETICDDLDNDCDGQIDEGWYNAGKYDQDTACGNCYTDCTTIYNKPNAQGVCDSSSETPICYMACDSGYYDLNALPDDGCEFVVDTQAIYVATPANGGTNDSACGTWDFPCGTITYGISKADSDPNYYRVLVSSGAYYESVALVNGVELFGGYNSRTWVRDIEANPTVIYGTTVGGHKKTIIAADINSSITRVDGFVVYGVNATSSSQNSYGIYIRNSDSNLIITNNLIWAEAGGPGVTGATGADGSNGSNGSSGLAAYEPAGAYNSYEQCINNNAENSGGSGGSQTCDTINVSGGSGGMADCPDFDEDINMSVDCNLSSDDQSVTTSGSTAPNGGGAGGLGGCDSQMDYGCLTSCNAFLPTCSQGNKSSPGENGLTGNNGSGGSGCSFGQGGVSGYEWTGTNGGNGTAGSHGRGGGGGGAGGGVETYDSASCADDGYSDIGGSGGGGGAGGCGGRFGVGGTAGGASISIFVYFTSDPGGNIPAISDNEIHRGFGGTGGNGGTGGMGGAGGYGGSGGAGGVAGTSYWSAASGANGGDGGDGGHGGGGGGGCGGASYGIFASGEGGTNLTTWKTVNTFGIGGGGGSGGFGGGSSSGGSSGGNGSTGGNGDTNF